MNLTRPFSRTRTPLAVRCAGCLLLFALALVPLTSAAQSATKTGVALALQATTNGPGLALHIQPISRLQVRVMHTYLPLSHAEQGEHDGFAGDVQGRLRAGGLAMWVEWFPFGHRFHLTGGVQSGRTRIDVDARPTARFDNDNVKTFSPERIGHLEATVRYRPLNPYAGLGWGNALNSRLSFMIDAGVYFLGAPQVEMQGTGLIAPTARQAGKLEAALSSFRYLPHLGMSIAYQF